MKRVLLGILVSFGLLMINAPAMAHGGGGIEADSCVVNIGNYRMHFTAYQPEAIGGKELCWDLPATGNSILVFDLVEKVLRDRPVEVRVVQQQPGTGGPADYKTLAERPPEVYPKGTIELDTEFSNPGKYTAVVTLGGDQPLVFRTPIRVAISETQTLEWVAVGVVGAALVGVIVWFERRSRRKKEAQA